MDKEFKKGKWTNTSGYRFLDVYNVGPELVVSTKVLQARIDAEQHSSILEEINKINFDPYKDLRKDIIDNIVKEWDKSNG